MLAVPRTGSDVTQPGEPAGRVRQALLVEGPDDGLPQLLRGGKSLSLPL